MSNRLSASDYYAYYHFYPCDHDKKQLEVEDTVIMIQADVSHHKGEEGIIRAFDSNYAGVEFAVHPPGGQNLNGTIPNNNGLWVDFSHLVLVSHAITEDDETIIQKTLASINKESQAALINGEVYQLTLRIVQ
jgi:hypothetical protein